MKKAFDAVEMKRAGAQRIYEESAGMTPEEQLAYWQEANREFREWRAGHVRGQSPTPPRT